MSSSKENPQGETPPVSAFTGPAGELIQQGMLQPPSRPGLMAMLDRYEVLRILGSGGMGIVLLARDSSSGRNVAIKLVKSELVSNQNVAHRFLKEAGHLKRLRHTNIVPVEEISDRAEGPYFVMPYFEKGSLANRIKPGKPLDTESILDIATQVAEGLAFAHRSGIIHRDLKPANLMMGADGQICLGDFGLARTVFNDSIVDVESRHLEGTAPYMSPAVAAGNAEDTRCDIYSFGALLYEMLTGQPPYQGRGTKEILDQIVAGPPKPITSLNPAADRGLVAVAERALARELRDRYAEMRDVLHDLQRVKDGKPPARRREWKWNYLPVTISAAAGILVIGLLAWMFTRHAPEPAKPPTHIVTQPDPSTVVPPPVIPTDNTPTAPPVATPQPKLATFVGQFGVGGYADGTGTNAQFRLPNNLTADHDGNVYVADTANNVIRKITTNGTVSTLAGVAGTHGSNDGKGNQAEFWAPFGITVDTSNIIYVADTGNNLIRRITPEGTVTTLAGSPHKPGYTDGKGDTARFRNPWSVAVDSSGSVIVADMSNDTIRKITPDGTVTTLAGQAGVAGNADGYGTSAQFNDPFAVAVDSSDNIYVSDSANDTIRKITPAGAVVTLAGLPGYAGNVDGSASNARFWNPQGLAVDDNGDIYVADTGNNAIREITPEGMVSHLTDLADTNAPAMNLDKALQLNSPGGVAVDSNGNIYVADTINQCVRKLFAPH